MDGMQDQLLISIIIPTKNRCSLLSETLVSVRNQTYLNWEAVVVDDLSDDNTWSNLEELARHDSRIRPVLRAGPVGGAGEARNQGFAASCGQYVIFLDSDDLLAPTSLEIRIKALEQYPDMDAIAFDMEYFRQTPGESHALCVESTHLNEGVDPLDAFLTSRSPWLTSGPIWRREAVAHYGFWKSSHDLQYHTRALIAGALIKHINIIDGYVRIHENAQCSKTSGANYATWRNEFLNERIQLLLEQEMLTHRRKRLLGWSCLLYSLGCAVERPRLHFGVVFSNWNAALRREMVGYLGYVVGLSLILLQLSGLLGLAPREFVRMIIYLDLKRQPVLSRRFLLSVIEYLKYLAAHLRHWKRTSTDTA